MCQKGACCFSEAGCDGVASGVQCSDFEPCKKVFVGSDTPGNEHVEDTSYNGTDKNEGDVVWNPDAVDSACEANMVVELAKRPDQPSLCEQVCTPGSCCFDKATKCDVRDPERFCTIYSACSTLFPDEDEENANPPVDSEAIMEACQKDDLTDCETLCEPGICCFVGDACAVPYPDVDDEQLFCDTFAVCSKIYQGEQRDAGNDGENGEVDESWVDQLDGDDGDNEDIDESWVDEIGGNDNGEGGSTNTENHIVEIMDIDGTVVGEDVIQKACTTGSVKCETLCKQGACCFEGGCTMEHAERYCVAFGVCSQFYPGE